MKSNVLDNKGKVPKIFITGVAGFLGSHIADCFLKDNYENTISKCCDELNIKVGQILQPSKQDYIKGSSLDVDLHSYQEVFEYCSMRLASSKILPKNVMSA